MQRPLLLAVHSPRDLALGVPVAGGAAGSAPGRFVGRLLGPRAVDDFGELLRGFLDLLDGFHGALLRLACGHVEIGQCRR